MLELKLLLLLIIANGTPIVTRQIFGRRFEHPIDFGWRLKDGHPLFGLSKTFRGVISAVIMTMIGALMLNLPLKLGLLIGVWAMLGDLLSSFVKRRLGMAPSSKALGLDQIPEAFFPLVAVSTMLGLGWWQITYLTLLFMVIELSLSRVLYKFKIRKRPY